MMLAPLTKYPRWYFYVGVCVLVLVLSVLYERSTPTLSNAWTMLAGSGHVSINPAMNHTVGTFGISVTKTEEPMPPLRVMSGTCIKMIKINQTTVSFAPRLLCDTASGTVMDINQVVALGENQIVVVPWKTNWAYVSFQAYDRISTHLIRISLFGVFAGITAWAAYSLTRDKYATAIMTAAFAMFYHQFVTTDFMHYPMDMPGHLDYIAYIAQLWSIPAPRDGWMFYHAPWYYIIQGAVLHWANLWGSADPVAYVRLLNIALFMAFQFLAMLMLRKLLRHPAAYYPMLLFVAFYPSGIMFSTRLDSHLLYYPLYMTSIYSLYTWLEKPKPKAFGASLIWLGCAIASRINATILLPIYALAMLSKASPRREWRSYFKAKPVILGLAIICLGFASNQGRVWFYHHFIYADKYEQQPLGVDNLDRLPKKFMVEDTLARFVTFDADAYWKYPFWSTSEDKAGRQYFWISLLKSSLYGEFAMPQKPLAQLLNTLILAISLFTIGYTLLDLKYYLHQFTWRVSATLFFIPLGAIMWASAQIPFASTQDFRYIYPALIGLAGMNGHIIERLIERRHKVLFIAAMILFLAFSLTTVLFFFGQMSLFR